MPRVSVLVSTCTSPEHTHAHRHTNTHAYTHTQTHTEKEEISQIKLPSSCVLIFSFFFSRSQRVPSGCLYFHVLVAYSRNGFQVVSLKGAKSSRASCSGEIFKWLMLDGVTRRRRGEKKKATGVFLKEMVCTSWCHSLSEHVASQLSPHWSKSQYLQRCCKCWFLHLRWKVRHLTVAHKILPTALILHH